MAELDAIGKCTLEFMDELTEKLPEESKIITVGIVAEIKFKCDNCDEWHTVIPVRTSTESDIHTQALFEQASYCTNGDWIQALREEEAEGADHLEED